MSSDENLYLNVEISSTETDTDYESDDSIGELSNRSGDGDTSINVGIEDDEPVNEEENETVVEGERHTDLDGNHNVTRSDREWNIHNCCG